MPNLIDNFGRPINYLRLSITDLCNLRCLYCMPEEGLDLSEKNEILSCEELEKLVRIFVSLGITKLRITGGEPFVRKGVIDFLERLSKIDGLEGIYITTNGVLTHNYIKDLKRIGISGVNLSLDTLDRKLFHEITRRDKFDSVMKTFHSVLEHGIPLKVNAVVQDLNFDEIVELSKLTKEHPIEFRFIEEMPFDGLQSENEKDFLEGKLSLGLDSEERNKTASGILKVLREEYPILIEDQEKYSTCMSYKIPGHQGKIGIIAGYSRLFCSSCNRVRVTSEGMMKTCLYGASVLNLKENLRNGVSDEEIKREIIRWIGKRYETGFESSLNRDEKVLETMAAIGG